MSKQLSWKSLGVSESWLESDLSQSYGEVAYLGEYYAVISSVHGDLKSQVLSLFIKTNSDFSEYTLAIEGEQVFNGETHQIDAIRRATDLELAIVHR